MYHTTLDILKDAKEQGFKYVVIGKNRCNTDIFFTNDTEEANQAHNEFRSFGSYTTTYEDGAIIRQSD